MLLQPCFKEKLSANKSMHVPSKQCGNCFCKHKRQIIQRIEDKNNREMYEKKSHLLFSEVEAEFGFFSSQVN